MAKTLVATIVSSSVSFGIYFVVAGAFFLDAYRVPHVQVRGLAVAGRYRPRVCSPRWW